MAFWSMHIGSGPGVFGLSGMQVNPFVPLCSVRIFPSASIATTVAPFATLGGAALLALAIICVSVGAAFVSFVSAAYTVSVRVIHEAMKRRGAVGKFRIDFSPGYVSSNSRSVDRDARLCQVSFGRY